MIKNKIINFLIKNRIFFILIFIILIFSVMDPRFLSSANIRNLLIHSSVNGIMVVGMTVLLISGYFDLSIGSVLSLAGLVAVGLQPTLGLIPSTIAGILAGCAVGAINGVLVTFGKINAFIATLGTLILFNGVNLTISGGWPIPGTIMRFMQIWRGSLGPIPFPIIYFGAFVLVFWFILRWTDFGRNAYAIGGNEQAARLSGISVNKYKMSYFIFSGFCASFAGIVLASRLNTGSPILGEETPLIVIAAVILGGTSLKGGIGTMQGSLFGILVIGAINNGLNLLNVQSYYQLIIRGSILISVVLFDVYIEKTKARKKLKVA